MDEVKASAVYRLYDEHEALLYIGVTRNPPSRWKDHRKEMFWWREVTDKRLTWYSTHEEAWEAERHAIRTEGPRYNKSSWPGMAPQLPPGVPPQPSGTRIAYQHRETRVGYRIQWLQWRLTLQDALETIREQRE
ncbi:GIY-YIG nuclease family protein [Streptomyces filamentosus]|uniref:GIY-YIG nuclease family protein n=1 Tax=Streptomyces filamentosus TaxID=67294 RepID=UPI00332FCCF6